MSLLIVGSVALDSVKTAGGMVNDALGGSATYFSIAATLFSPEVNVVAVVGDDFPKDYIELLANRGINLDGLKIERGRTFRWSGAYDESFGDPKTLDTQLNVFETFRPVLPKHYCSSRLVFLGNIDPSLQREVVRQIESPALVAADTMNFWIEGKLAELEKLLPSVDLLLINALEVRMLSGEMGLLKGAKKVLEMGPRMLIVKRGESGSMLVTENEVFVVPAYPVEKVIDPTGAGDSFAGGFMGYLASTGKLDTEEFRRAVVAGTVVASFDVEGFGVARLSGISPDELRRRMEHFRKITEFTVPEI